MNDETLVDLLPVENPFEKVQKQLVDYSTDLDASQPEQEAGANNANEKGVNLWCYPCPSCSKIFKTQRLLSAHIKNHELSAKLQCKFCAHSFNYKINLLVHELIEHTDEFITDPSDLSCRICQKSFVRLSALKCHLKSHERPDSLTCGACKKAFLSRYSYDLHECKPSLTVNCTYTCKICATSLPTIGQYRKHMAICNPNALKKKPKAPAEISFSENTFPDTSATALAETDKSARPSKLKARQSFRAIIAAAVPRRENYSRAKPCKTTTKGNLSCPHCMETFRFKSLLDRHLNKHAQSGAFTCHVCSKKLRYKSSLVTHMKMHENEQAAQEPLLLAQPQSAVAAAQSNAIPEPIRRRPRHLCRLCCASFRNKYYLSVHVAEHMRHRRAQLRELRKCERLRLARTHGQMWRAYKCHNRQQALDRSFACDSCQSVFKHRHHLTEHQKAKHWTSEQCERTGAEIGWPRCLICGRRYVSEASLRRHLHVIHGAADEGAAACSGTLSCTQCHYRTKYKDCLLRHTRRHQLSLPYQCPMCWRRFRHLSSYRRHAVNVHNRCEDPHLSEQVEETPPQPLFTSMLLQEGEKSPTAMVRPVSTRKSSGPRRARPTPVEARGLYQCALCEATFARVEGLELHVGATHPEHCASDIQLFTCPLCFVMSPVRAAMERHTALHANVEANQTQFICGECGHVDEHMASLHQHIGEKHPPTPLPLFRCLSCRFTCQTKADMFHHRRNRVCQQRIRVVRPTTSKEATPRCKPLLRKPNPSGLVEYVCAMCSLRYTSLEKSQAHAMMHLANLCPSMSEFVCQKCGTKFGAAREFWSHRATCESCVTQVAASAAPVVESIAPYVYTSPQPQPIEATTYAPHNNVCPSTTTVPLIQELVYGEGAVAASTEENGAGQEATTTARYDLVSLPVGELRSGDVLYSGEQEYVVLTDEEYQRYQMLAPMAPVEVSVIHGSYALAPEVSQPLEVVNLDTGTLCTEALEATQSPNAPSTSPKHVESSGEPTTYQYVAPLQYDTNAAVGEASYCNLLTNDLTASTSVTVPSVENINGAITLVSQPEPSADLTVGLDCQPCYYLCQSCNIICEDYSSLQLHLQTVHTSLDGKDTHYLLDYGDMSASQYFY